METFVTIKKNSKIHINSIPVIPIEILRDEIIRIKLRPAGFFGQKVNENFVKLFVVLADDNNHSFLVSSSLFSNGSSYESITKDVPSFHIYEREFFEQFNIEPKGHPWLKPVRKNQDDYEFFEMRGDEVHQVAVGPIHAGVIEPGHFRFMCNGENVYHLEIALGYQHKGIEDLMIKNHSCRLAESIAGDSVIAHNLTYCELIEALGDIRVSKKAKLIRKAALELERAAVHTGDLGAISGDIGYLMGASVFGALRTLIINSTLQLCGSRFGRGFVTIGGTNFDVTSKDIDEISATLKKVSKNIERMTKTMLKNSTVISRLEKTGIISSNKAEELGLVGMAARASGVNIDSRISYYDDIDAELRIIPKEYQGSGDVYSRFELRYKEIMESFSIIKKLFAKIKVFYDEDNLNRANVNLYPSSFVLSINEGWRGEVIHIAITDSEGKISRYKIKDPSFNNWYGLQLAVRNNGISDFPLCNKSFNLSYSGFDL